MPFKYKAIKNGTRESGILDVVSKVEAIAQLRKKGVTILSIEQVSGSGAGNKQRKKKGTKANKVNFSHLLISKGQVELVIRQLSSLLNAGVPIISALNAVAGQAPGRLKDVLSRVTLKLKQGNTLRASLEQEAPFIGKVSMGLIGVGEANGQLDTALSNSADLMEKSRKLKSQIMQAMAYPAIVMLGAIGVSYYMVAVVFPSIIGFIQKSGKKVPLPLPTRILIDINDFMTAYGLYVAILPFVLVFVIVMLRKNPATGSVIDHLFIRMPIMGVAIREHNNTMWSRTMGSLLQSGISAVGALGLVQQTIGNLYFLDQFKVIEQIVRQGRSLSDGIKKTALHRLCPMATTMIAVSEESGGLDDSLLYIANYSEEIMAKRVELLGKLIEPAIFVVVGGMVGFVYFAFFLAMLAATKSAT